MSKTVRKPNKKSSIWPLLLIVIGIACAAAAWDRGGAIGLPVSLSRLEPGSYRVTYVDDGDTIRVRDSLGHQDTVRLIGVDTPEVKDPRKPVQCFGQAASSFTKHGLSGQRVKLVADPLSGERDKYNRLLRYVYLSDGTLWNAKLVSEGYGFAYIVFMNSKQTELIADEAMARQTNKGLWAGCRVDESTRIKQTNSS